MKISDIQRGKSTTVEVQPASADNFGEGVSVLQEVELFFSELESEVLLRIGERSWAVEGSDARYQESLNKLGLRGLPRVSWVAARRPRGLGEVSKLVLEVREFPRELLWAESVDLGVDDKVVELVRKKHKDLRTIPDIVGWLSEQILFVDSGGTCRVLLSGSPDPRADKSRGFRLQGNGVVADVARDENDRLIVSKVVEPKRVEKDNDFRPVILCRGQVQFVDYTVAGRFREETRSQLDQVVGAGESYLAIWGELNKLERKGIQGRAREFGWLAYKSRQQLADGRWRFGLVDDDRGGDRMEHCIRVLEDGESVDLEAALNLPSTLTQTDTDSVDEIERRGRIYAGECVGTNLRRQTVDLRLPEKNDEGQDPPPEKGFLFLSLGADATRLERRKQAQQLIQSAGCPMPQLGLLLEDRPVHLRRLRKDKALTKSAREAFGGEPTGRQVEALSIALNTPDIALIQGPPGTGKTRTIAALQTRLAEIEEASGNIDNVAGRYLLTSYQHDAVENVASATQVYGLPAIKVGRKRGHQEETDGFERWRQDRIEAARARLSGADELPAAVALRRCRDIAVGYLKAPSRGEDVALLVGEIRDLAGPHIPPQLQDRLLELQQGLRNPQQIAEGGDADLEQSLKAVRGLRTDATAFSDDGDMQARKALIRLQRLDLLDAGGAALLEKAADWDIEVEPDFLSDLKALQAALIDRLMPDERPATGSLINADVEDALTTVVDALGGRVQSSAGGVDRVLHDYCDELEEDRDGVRQAVEQYTSVLAATCQQAVGYQMKLRKGEGNHFETVVVDEAARANPLDLFIPMSLAERRIILVGDHRQLPHILDQEIENDLESNVTEKTREMLRESLFERLFKQLRERERSDNIKRTVTLDVQYRMHPVLGQFVSDTFYKPHGESFDSGRDASELAHSLSRYDGAVAAWMEIPLGKGAEQSGQSKLRRAEASWIAGEAQRIMTERPDYSVGVISFYSAQVTEVLRQMEPLGLTEQLEDGSYRIHEAWRDTRDESGRLTERLRVGTVDAFQGKEFDVVLLSMTRSNDLPSDNPKMLRRKYGHLMLENRLCVAMSRQQRLLVVVGDSGMLQGQQAAEAVPGLIRFLKLCGGEHGVQLHV